MSGNEQQQRIDFTVDTDNLYREENITDLKVASIRRLTPINPDGSEDKSRTPVFVGHTQLMSPEGPFPLQASLEANSLEEAMNVFPEAMKQSLNEMIQKFEEMKRQQQTQQADDSRIIVPGR